MKENQKTFLAFVLVGLMLVTPLALLGTFVLSLRVPLAYQEYVPLSIRIIALLILLYFQNQFWRLVSRVVLLVEAVQERKLVWAGPPSRLYRRFVLRTAIMIVPLWLLADLVFPRFWVTGPVERTTLWLILAVGTVGSAIMYSRAYDDMLVVKRHLESVGLR